MAFILGRELDPPVVTDLYVRVRQRTRPRLRARAARAKVGPTAAAALRDDAGVSHAYPGTYLAAAGHPVVRLSTGYGRSTMLLEW